MNTLNSREPTDSDERLFLKLGELAFEEWNSAENEAAFAALDLTNPTKTGD